MRDFAVQIKWELFIKYYLSEIKMLVKYTPFLVKKLLRNNQNILNEFYYIQILEMFFIFSIILIDT